MDIELLVVLSAHKEDIILNNQILRKVFSNNENFSIIEIQERNLPHTLINRSLLRSIA